VATNYFYLNNFEDGPFGALGADGSLSTLGVKAVNAPPGPEFIGIIPPPFPTFLIDSVDEDDGVLDGQGNNGHSLFTDAVGIDFIFDVAQLGALPTHVGIVWTDGAVTTTFEAFDASGASLGKIGPVSLNDGSANGGTGEDRFFGVIHEGGISKIRITDSLSGIEVDHLQYGRASGGPDEELTALAPAILWVGLKNSDDQGTRFDLRAEVYINGTIVSDGITRCITGVTRNPNKAKEVGIPFGAISDGAFASGDELSLTLLTRIGTNPDDTKCPGHSNAVGLRLYYDAISRPSRFGAELTPNPLEDFFLHSDGTDFLDNIAPTGTTATFKDSSSH